MPEAQSLLTLQQISALTDLPIPALNNAIRAGRFPRPSVTLSKKARYWSKASIEKFMALQASQKGDRNV